MKFNGKRTVTIDKKKYMSRILMLNNIVYQNRTNLVYQ